jgi:UDP-N-acetylmuramoyl-L-alanyl-D-glutamate--2,6-diaminopimelate ligase
MKKLTELLKNIPSISSKGNLDISITDISLSSKHIQAGSLFVALVGSVTDGHHFIDDVIDTGATVIMYQNDPISFRDGITYIKVADTHDTVGKLASAFYDYPTEKLKLVGITGTNGKTTTATLLYKLFRNLGHKAGMIGTVVNMINDESFEAERTTPDAVSLNLLLSEMVSAGCEYCFMEVSSHAVSEKRIAGLVFAGGVFTNLTLDHLDYHKTFENYRDAKKAFFDSLPATSFAVSNKDDANGEYMLRDTKAKKYFYALKNDADFTDHLETKLIGEFNAYNALAIYTTAIALGENPPPTSLEGLRWAEKVKEEIKTLEPVEGRFQYFKNSNGITGIVDYAHTPDALENVLRTVQGLSREASGEVGKRIISVFGCGGDRDKSKRPLMAKIGYDMSDIIILTSDNPRTENPAAILEEMQKGLPREAEGEVGPDHPLSTSELGQKVYIIPDRRLAIQKACALARAGDLLLIAGKGHEKYQEINGVKTHFDDMEELKKFLIY